MPHDDPVKYARGRHADDLTPKPRQWWDDDGYESNHRSMTIHENLEDATPTGVLDADGVMIVRLRERIPCGFRRER